MQSLFLSGTSAGWTTYSFNLSSLAAGSYQLRFAEADNDGVFQMGVDNASLQSTQSAVPEPASWTMMIVGFGMIGGAMRRRTRVTPVTSPDDRHS